MTKKFVKFSIGFLWGFHGVYGVPMALLGRRGSTARDSRQEAGEYLPQGRVGGRLVGPELREQETQ